MSAAGRSLATPVLDEYFLFEFTIVLFRIFEFKKSTYIIKFLNQGRLTYIFYEI